MPRPARLDGGRVGTRRRLLTTLRRLPPPAEPCQPERGLSDGRDHLARPPGERSVDDVERPRQARDLGLGLLGLVTRIRELGLGLCQSELELRRLLRQLLSTSVRLIGTTVGVADTKV